MSTETARRAKRVERRAATPVAGAIAGILFALLFGVSVSIITTTMSGLGSDTGEWLESGAQDFKFAIGLLPFARVALHRLMFAAAAEAGAIVAVYAKDPSAFAASTTYVFARNMVAQIFQVYALRMAGVFLISNATIWLRTGIYILAMNLRRTPPQSRGATSREHSGAARLASPPALPKPEDEQQGAGGGHEHHPGPPELNQHRAPLDVRRNPRRALARLDRSVLR